MANIMIIVGRTTGEVEMRYAQSGVAIGNVTVAIDREMSKAKKQEAEAKGEATADFLRVTLFGNTAEYAANHLKKGKKVFINGRIQTGNYINKEGLKVYTTEVVANNIEILEWENITETSFTDSDVPTPW